MPDTTIKSQLYVFPQEVTNLLLSSLVGTPTFLTIMNNIFSEKYVSSQYPEATSLKAIDNMIRNNILTMWQWCEDENNPHPLAQLLRALHIHWPPELPGEITPAEKGLLLKRAVILWYEILPNLTEYIRGTPETEIMDNYTSDLLDVLEILSTKQYLPQIIARVITQPGNLSAADIRIMAGKVDALISKLRRNFASHKKEIEEGIPPKMEVIYLLGIQS